MSLVIAAALQLVSVLPPTELKRAVPPKDSIVVDAARHRADRVVVKFVEDSRITLVDGRFGVGSVDRILAGRTVESFFAGREHELRALRQRVLASTPAGRTPPADLGLYYEVRTAGIVDSRRLIADLHRLEIVELAYPRELPVPPPGDIPPITPNFTNQQSYREGAPLGIDGLAIQQLAGSWGSGVTVLDIEWGWHLDHEDVQALRPASMIGPPPKFNTQNDHGLAVVGMLTADPDDYGVTGLTPDAEILVASNFPDSGYSVANAIVLGLQFLDRGDVMLLEAQAMSPLGFVPTEWNQADFDAIQNATALGVFTIEAAGNGGVNLDDPTFNGMFSLEVRDSGALVVAATAGQALMRQGSSTYGSRIDANGWGNNVVTTGYGDLFDPNDPRQTYTNEFSGTSSASPMVAAAVIAISGAARAQLGPTEAAGINFVAIRHLLREYGTPCPPEEPIGRRPDLSRILQAASLQRDLRIVDPVRLGSSARVEIRAPFAPSASDVWMLIGSEGTANFELPGPFFGAHCNRFLLDPTTLVMLTAGLFGNGSTVTLNVPNDLSLYQARYYLQALAVQMPSGEACLSSSSLLWVGK